VQGDEEKLFNSILASYLRTVLQAIGSAKALRTLGIIKHKLNHKNYKNTLLSIKNG